MENESKFLKGFLSGICVMLVCAGAVLFVKGEMQNQNNSVKEIQTETQTVDENTSELALDRDGISKKLDEMENLINQYYLDEIDSEEVETWMYKGLIAGLGDRYADYYTKEELEKNLESSSGAYEGIGAVMSQDKTTGLITITRCYEGAPAAESGLLPGDMLYTVNNTLVTGMELSEVVSMIKTEPGDTVQIRVARDGEQGYLTFDVQRAQVEVPTVTCELLEDQIGYIEITEFDTVTEMQFNQALSDLEDQGMEKLIIDLRNNPGGVLKTVCSMLNQILPEGLIVYTEDKYGERMEYRSDGKHAFTKPLALLINGNSASAAEIFAGAVKDYGIGTLVGTTTFGKGIVQRVINLNDGTAVKMTVSKYYTPKGTNIHEVGIEPDVEIELDEALSRQVTIEKEEDNQLQKAIEVLQKQ